MQKGTERERTSLCPEVLLLAFSLSVAKASISPFLWGKGGKTEDKLRMTESTNLRPGKGNFLLRRHCHNSTDRQVLSKQHKLPSQLKSISWTLLL